MRIFTRQQPDQQLIQIKPVQQCGTFQRNHAADPLGRCQGSQLGFPRPTDGKRLERLQNASQAGSGPFCPLRHQRHPAVIAREKINNQTAFTVHVTVQDKTGLPGNPHTRSRFRNGRTVRCHMLCCRHFRFAGQRCFLFIGSIRIHRLAFFNIRLPYS